MSATMVATLSATLCTSMHVGRRVSHHVGHYNVVSTVCEISETLTEWKFETITDDGRTDGRDRCYRCLRI